MRKFVPAFLLLTAAAGPAHCTGCDGGASPTQVAERGHVFFKGQDSETEREVFAADLLARLNENKPTTVVDVRPAYKYGQGHIPKSLNLPLPSLFTQEVLGQLPKDGTPLVLVSEDGHAASMAAGVLGAMGYNAYALRFGMIGWTPSSQVGVHTQNGAQTIQGLGGPVE